MQIEVKEPLWGLGRVLCSEDLKAIGGNFTYPVGHGTVQMHHRTWVEAQWEDIRN